ncbi:MAG: peptidoglycan-binding domain-containing protein [Candidatus Omnitrophota bacterium]|jgi:murein L,D-transpeptidase YcbB/YkuD
MGRKGFVYFIALIATVVFISGCETVPKKFREEVSGIKSKVDTLESRVEGVESKQTDVERMASEQAQKLEEMKAEKEKTVKTNVTIKNRSTKSHAHMKEIQACLQNAGFYNGKIDGVKGKGTRKSIRSFQKANGLNSDGIVGARTWELLSKYAAGPVDRSAASAGSEEGANTK